MTNTIVDKSVYFGMSNFLFIDSDETDVTYNYYGFMDRHGLILIMRTDKNLSNARYYTNVGTYTTIWADRDNSATVYCLPNELENRRV